ncbi:MAG: pirin-like C-terminal cupin domain-containing protein [Candidatus Thorarchaeota archaeon]
MNEPVPWSGPFFMNTKEEVMQALADYHTGHLGQIDF